MKTLTSYLVIFIISFQSCNNREERERALKDLEVLQQKVLDFSAQLEGSKNRINVFEQDLVVAQDRLNRVGGYQFLRTAQEREQQIREATASIQDIRQKITNMQNYLISLGDSLQNAQIKMDIVKEKLKR